MTEEELAILLPLLKKRIPYDEDIFGNNEGYESSLTELLSDSKDILLNKLYPFEDYSERLIPLNKYNWVLRCSVEIYNLADKWGVINYSENGLTWAKYTDGLSKSLMSEIISHVGIPKKEVDTESGD